MQVYECICFLITICIVWNYADILMLIGTLLAGTGSCVSIYGTLVNNLRKDHIRAMEIWSYSNILLLVWSIGFHLDLWNGGLSATALITMYAVFTVSNLWGLRQHRNKKKRKKDVTL